MCKLLNYHIRRQKNPDWSSGSLMDTFTEKHSAAANSSSKMKMDGIEAP